MTLSSPSSDSVRSERGLESVSKQAKNKDLSQLVKDQGSSPRRCVVSERYRLGVSGAWTGCNCSNSSKERSSADTIDLDIAIGWSGSVRLTELVEGREVVSCLDNSGL